MSDPMYIWGDPRICSTMVFTLIGSVFAVMSVIFYQEQTKDLYILRWLELLKHNRLKYKLNVKNYNRLIRRSLLLFKYLVRPASLFLVVSLEYIVIHSTYSAYTDPNTDYSLIGSLFSLFLLTTVILQGVCAILILPLLVYVIIQILIMKFNELNDKIVSFLCYNHQNTYQLPSLISLIREHDYFTQMTQQINVTIKWLLFIVYYMVTPALQISFYCVHHRATHPICRIFCAVIVIAISVVLFVPVVLSTQIAKSAKMPNRFLQAFVGRKADKVIPIRIRLKIMNFVEHLSQVDIGFYCLDLFPMNNYEFYQYLYIAGLNYILIMKIF